MLDFINYFLNLPMSQVLGVGGFLFYFGSFTALQFRLLDGNGVTYCVLNMTAASLVMISLLDAFNLATALINGSWILIGLIGLGMRFRRRKLAAFQRAATAAVY